MLYILSPSQMASERSAPRLPAVFDSGIAWIVLIAARLCSPVGSFDSPFLVSSDLSISKASPLGVSVGVSAASSSSPPGAKRRA